MSFNKPIFQINDFQLYPMFFFFLFLALLIFALLVITIQDRLRSNSIIRKQRRVNKRLMKQEQAAQNEPSHIKKEKVVKERVPRIKKEKVVKESSATKRSFWRKSPAPQDFLQDNDYSFLQSSSNSLPNSAPQIQTAPSVPYILLTDTTPPVYQQPLSQPVQSPQAPSWSEPTTEKGFIPVEKPVEKQPVNNIPEEKSTWQNPVSKPETYSIDELLNTIKEESNPQQGRYQQAGSIAPSILIPEPPVPLPVPQESLPLPVEKPSVSLENILMDPVEHIALDINKITPWQRKNLSQILDAELASFINNEEGDAEYLLWIEKLKEAVATQTHWDVNSLYQQDPNLVIALNYIVSLAIQKAMNENNANHLTLWLHSLDALNGGLQTRNNHWMQNSYPLKSIGVKPTLEEQQMGAIISKAVDTLSESMDPETGLIQGNDYTNPYLLELTPSKIQHHIHTIDSILSLYLLEEDTKKFVLNVLNYNLQIQLDKVLDFVVNPILQQDQLALVRSMVSINDQQSYMDILCELSEIA